MRKIVVLLLLIILNGMNAEAAKVKNKEREVVIETTLGTIKVKLYNETPKHRDNFLKVAQSGAYNGVLFHRIINEFMIQVGDLSTNQDNTLAVKYEKEFDYLQDAEIVYPQLFHKKGVLAAARTADQVNPEKKSSSTQFYIVTGKVFNDSALQIAEKQKFEQLKQRIFIRLQNENKALIKELYRSGDRERLNSLRDELIAKTEKEAEQNKATAAFTPAQKEAYKTVGGTPHLDAEYTVFGEVTSGIEVVDSIQKVKTDAGDRPLEAVRIIKVTVK